MVAKKGPDVGEWGKKIVINKYMSHKGKQKKKKKSRR